MKRAGGLAAAGNMKGAQSELYKGGEFGAARDISQEMRAGQSHARALETHQLERAIKGQEMLGRLAGSIQSPEQFEMAKARLKKLGLPVDPYTYDQLPQLRQQSISVQEQLQNELQQRKIEILQQRANAKAGAPEKLTERQHRARTALSAMNEAKTSATPILGDDGSSESPMGMVSGYLSDKAPDDVAASYRSKQQNQYYQAAEQWVDAKLRFESGATVTPEEIKKGMRIYWPVPGDDIITRRNKARARKAVEDAMGLEFKQATTPNAQPSQALPQAGGLPDDPSQWTDEQLLQQLNGQ